MQIATKDGKPIIKQDRITEACCCPKFICHDQFPTISVSVELTQTPAPGQDEVDSGTPLRSWAASPEETLEGLAAQFPAGARATKKQQELNYYNQNRGSSSKYEAAQKVRRSLIAGFTMAPLSTGWWNGSYGGTFSESNGTIASNYYVGLSITEIAYRSYLVSLGRVIVPGRLIKSYRSEAATLENFKVGYYCANYDNPVWAAACTMQNGCGPGTPLGLSLGVAADRACKIDGFQYRDATFTGTPDTGTAYAIATFQENERTATAQHFGPAVTFSVSGTFENKKRKLKAAENVTFADTDRAFSCKKWNDDPANREQGLPAIDPATGAPRATWDNSLPDPEAERPTSSQCIELEDLAGDWAATVTVQLC